VVEAVYRHRFGAEQGGKRGLVDLPALEGFDRVTDNPPP
jgi:hypothetical protein